MRGVWAFGTYPEVRFNRGLGTEYVREFNFPPLTFSDVFFYKKPEQLAAMDGINSWIAAYSSLNANLNTGPTVTLQPNSGAGLLQVQLAFGYGNSSNREYLDMVTFRAQSSPNPNYTYYSFGIRWTKNTYTPSIYGLFNQHTTSDVPCGALTSVVYSSGNTGAVIFNLQFQNSAWGNTAFSIYSPPSGSKEFGPYARLSQRTV